MQTGSWQHVVATFDGSTARLYRNGAQVFSQAVSGTLATTANPLRWGDAFTGGVDANFLGGGLDEAAVYGAALSAAQISSHYSSGTTTPPTKPAAPTGLTARRAPGQVSLSWSPGAGGTAVVGYRVYRRTGTTGPFSPDRPVPDHHDHQLHGLRAHRRHPVHVLRDGPRRRRRGERRQRDGVGHAARVGLVPPRSSSYSTLVAGTAGLTGYWRLGEASGAVACATAGPNGAYAGGTSLAQPGRSAGDPDTSVALDGSSGFVSVTNTAALNSTRVTVEAWVNPRTVAGSQSIARKDGQYYLKVYDGKLQGWLWWDATTRVTVTSAAVVTAGAWQHVALTFDGTTARLYRNGAQVATLAASGKSVATTTNPLRWGDTLSGGVDGNFLGGGLDEVAVYNAALSAARSPTTSAPDARRGGRRRPSAALASDRCCAAEPPGSSRGRWATSMRGSRTGWSCCCATCGRGCGGATPGRRARRPFAGGRAPGPGAPPPRASSQQMTVRWNGRSAGGVGSAPVGPPPPRVTTVSVSVDPVSSWTAAAPASVVSVSVAW